VEIVSYACWMKGLPGAAAHGGALTGTGPFKHVQVHHGRSRPVGMSGTLLKYRASGFGAEPQYPPMLQERSQTHEDLIYPMYVFL